MIDYYSIVNVIPLTSLNQDGTVTWFCVNSLLAVVEDIAGRQEQETCSVSMAVICIKARTVAMIKDNWALLRRTEEKTERT